MREFIGAILFLLCCGLAGCDDAGSTPNATDVGDEFRDATASDSTTQPDTVISDTVDTVDTVESDVTADIGFLDTDSDGDADTDSPGEVCTDESTCAVLSREMLGELNRLRATAGCGDLTWNDTLAQVARECAVVMQAESSTHACRGTLADRLAAHEVGFVSAGQNNAHYTNIVDAAAAIAEGEYIPDCDMTMTGVAMVPAEYGYIWMSVVFVQPPEG